MSGGQHEAKGANGSTTTSKEATKKSLSDVALPFARTKEERRKLNGFDCPDCIEYYRHQGLSGKELEAKLKDCSRHRGVRKREETPEYFWEFGFPSFPERDGKETNKIKETVKALDSLEKDLEKQVMEPKKKPKRRTVEWDSDDEVDVE